MQGGSERDCEGVIGARMAKGEAGWLAADGKILTSCTGMTPSNRHRPAGRGNKARCPTTTRA